MNITHAEHEEIVGDKLIAIFNRQKELMEKYHDIEARSGLMQTEDCPVDLNDKRGQARIKDFSWRVTEELGEALDALDSGDHDHYKEELVDGLHFLTEMTILTGFELTEIIPERNMGDDFLDAICGVNPLSFKVSLEELVYDFVMQLGMMCNCLKNKAWKQTNMLTDKNAFLERLQNVWSQYGMIMATEMSPDEVADMYLRKSQVNKFRQRSNY